MRKKQFPQSDSRIQQLLEGRLHDPFGFLGLHRDGDEYVVRSFQPYSGEVALETADGLEPMQRLHPDGFFEWRGKTEPPRPYRLRLHDDQGERLIHDPYAFGVQITQFELHLFNEGRLHQGYRLLGSQQVEMNGVSGIRFAVWAPNAERVSVVGEFNRWDGRMHPMRAHGVSGVWELFLPGVAPGALYRYEIRSAQGDVTLKIDPYAQAYEKRPGNACLAGIRIRHEWKDTEWMVRRRDWDWQHAPLNIYEIHAGSWKRHPDGSFYSYRELAEHLIPYVQEMGYTHIELLPVSEHPLDESWGYQCTGYFAATSRFGSPDDLAYFVDACHQANIGVLLDWVPAHFPQDSFALAKFDGTALYEHADPRQGYHHDWGTHIFNFGRNEVKSFLLSSAHYWLAELHFDGLRVDAVASMLYLDYSRKQGEWVPNKYGGRENLDAIGFLRELNVMVHDSFHGAITLAEESTSWPAVSRPTYIGGLGFSMKWNMGWMNDTLSFFKNDPVHRRYHFNQLTFGQLYAYTENFVLPFSHDEVVHGKHSLLGKMPGDAWQKFANLRLLLAYQMTTPGKKLNFMGNELGQGHEWRDGWEVDWWQLGQDAHRGVQAMMRDINRLYRDRPTLHELDFFQDGFNWIDCNDAERSLLVFQRRARSGQHVVVALNFTPVPRHRFRIGLPEECAYREVFNSDSRFYGGGDVGNGNGVTAHARPWMGQPCSAEIELPPLACIIFEPV